MDRIFISTPYFSLNRNKSENSNWIRLMRFTDRINIDSNFSSWKELKGCTTYAVTPLTSTLLDVFKGFAEFSCNQREWSERMRFVFEVKIECDAVQPIIWQHCITEMKPAINTKCILLNLSAEEATHTVVNNRGVPCVVRKNLIANKFNVVIEPETFSASWNLLTVMFRKVENNALEWLYLHTTSERVSPNQKYEPVIIFDIYELKMTLENVADFETVDITNVLEPHRSDIKELPYLRNLSVNLKEYFDANKFCDVSIHVQDQLIRAHKIALSNASTVCHGFFHANEKLDTIHIAEFDYETIAGLIEYIYTGKVNKVTDHLFIAADKYRIVGLKELCEMQLIETIRMETIVNLLVLADRYKACALFEKVMDFIGENCKAVSQLDGAKRVFAMYPDLAFKLFAKISLK